MKDRSFFLELLGKNIKAVRQNLGISQEKLAEISGLHRTYIGMLERGERNITVYNMYKISKALGIEIKEIFPYE